MCGIAGILLSARSDPNRLAAIEPMTAALYHRGPDGDGFWADKAAGIAFGHRRLAIVDLSEAGRQPMVSHSGDLVVTYNGEIYNFTELRAELEALGHRFRGHSDTEVMLAAFESFGIEPGLRRLAGMFAIAVWDRRNRMLHLARDRMGKKPLHIALIGGALHFASELKALRAAPGFSAPVNRHALSMVLRQGWVPDDCCIWDGVLKLRPGTVLSVGAGELGGELAGCDADALRARMRPWWSLAEAAAAGQAAPFALDEEALTDRLDELLRLAVRQRMVADVPLGAFLSGGTDSSTVVALMQAQSSRPVRTFTIGFADKAFDEAHEAARIAAHLGTDHCELRLTPQEAQAVVPSLPRIWDEPFADESQIPTFLVSRLARQHVTVALSGDGGDEAFGGYTRHYRSPSFAPALALPLKARRMASATLGLISDEAIEGIARRLPVSGSLRRSLTPDKLRKLVRLLDAADDRDLYERLTGLTGDPAPRAADAGAADIPALPDLPSRLMYRDMAGYLPGDILVKLDRASMAVSLEGRCPLLDHRVIEFAWRVPTHAKIRGGKGKWLLRRVLSRYVPEALFERPKQGFNVPVGAWLRGPLRDWAGDLLAPARLHRDGLLDPARVQACWKQHLSGQRDRGYELWAILMVEAWLAESGSPSAGLTEPPRGPRADYRGESPASPLSERDAA
jgi:asparagine synthase (glutamine-hydrolysing)